MEFEPIIRVVHHLDRLKTIDSSIGYAAEVKSLYDYASRGRYWIAACFNVNGREVWFRKPDTLIIDGQRHSYPAGLAQYLDATIGDSRGIICFASRADFDKEHKGVISSQERQHGYDSGLVITINSIAPQRDSIAALLRMIRLYKKVIITIDDGHKQERHVASAADNRKLTVYPEHPNGVMMLCTLDKRYALIMDFSKFILTIRMLDDAKRLKKPMNVINIIEQAVIGEARHLYDLPSTSDKPALPPNAVRSTFFYKDKRELIAKLQSTKGLLSVNLTSRWAAGGYEFMLYDTKAKVDKNARGYLKFGSWHEATLADAIYNAASSGEASIFTK